MLDGIPSVDVGGSKDVNGRVENVSCAIEDVTTEETPSGTDSFEVDIGVLESANIDDDNEVVGCPTILDVTFGVVVGSTEDIDGELDDVLGTTKDVANDDEATESGTKAVELNIRVLKSMALDEDSEGVGCTIVLDDTSGIDIGASEAVDGVLKEASSAVENVIDADTEIELKTEAVKVSNKVLESVATDRNWELVADSILVDEAISDSVGSSKVVNGGVDNVSSALEDATTNKDENESATDAVEIGTKVLDSATIDENEEADDDPTVLDEATSDNV